MPKLKNHFLFLFFIPLWLSAQKEKKQYEGPLRLGVLQGEADFFYTLRKNDTIYEGPFMLKNSDLAAVSASPLNFFSINGEFDNNLPSGKWNFQNGEFQTTGEGQLKDHLYQLEISGFEHVLWGDMKAGLPHNKWQLFSWEIENSQVNDTAFSAYFQLDEGVPGAFQVQQDSILLKGVFNEEAFADGVWQLTSGSLPEREEQWHFTEGQLKHIYYLNSGTADTLILDQETAQNEIITTSVNERFFQVISLKEKLARITDTLRQPSLGPGKLFSQALGHFYRIDSVMSVLSPASFLPEFKGRLTKFPYQSGEEKALESIEENLRQSLSRITAIKANPQLNLLKLSNETIFFYLEAALRLEKEFLRPLESVLEHHKNDVLEFVPRKNLLRFMLPEGDNLNLTLTVHPPRSKASQYYVLKDTSLLDKNATGLIGLKQLSQILLTSTKDIEGELNQILKEKHREKKLVQLEDSLMEKYDKVHYTLDSLEKFSSEENKKAWFALRQFTDKKLTEYSAMEIADAKEDAAKQVINCFDNIRKLGKSVAAIHEDRKKIEMEYTRKVWNPYTYTYMSENVKKRILTAYTDVLLPHFMDEIAENPSCDLAEQGPERLAALNQRMLELRRNDTDKLEKQLKRTEDPEEIMEIFGLQADE